MNTDSVGGLYVTDLMLLSCYSFANRLGLCVQMMMQPWTSEIRVQNMLWLKWKITISRTFIYREGVLVLHINVLSCRVGRLCWRVGKVCFRIPRTRAMELTVSIGLSMQAATKLVPTKCLVLQSAPGLCLCSEVWEMFPIVVCQQKPHKHSTSRNEDFATRGIEWLAYTVVLMQGGGASCSLLACIACHRTMYILLCDWPSENALGHSSIPDACSICFTYSWNWTWPLQLFG